MRRGTLTRRQALQAGAVGALGLMLPACGGSDEGGAASNGGRLALKTWEDHFLPEHLRAIRESDDLDVKATLIEDNLTNLQQLKRGASLNVVSADALWVPRFHSEKLIAPFNPEDSTTWASMYGPAKELAFWRDGAKQLAYPHAWAPHLIFYNPAEVSTPPRSFQDLLDPRFRNKIALQKEPNDIMAKAGVATGAKEPFAMTDAEIAQAKEFLKQLKPNVLKLPVAGDEVAQSFSQGVTVGSAILGIDLVVKDAGGPELKSLVPSDGTIAFADGEMISAEADRPELALELIDLLNTPERVAERFLKFKHPYFSEGAYKILVDQGEQELADRLLYNQPEVAAQDNVALVAPPPNQQAYTDAFNEVFGA